jgi:hypothetical protein
VKVKKKSRKIEEKTMKVKEKSMRIKKFESPRVDLSRRRFGEPWD